MPDKHEVGGSTPLGPTIAAKAVKIKNGRNEAKAEWKPKEEGKTKVGTEAEGSTKDGKRREIKAEGQRKP